MNRKSYLRVLAALLLGALLFGGTVWLAGRAPEYALAQAQPPAGGEAPAVNTGTTITYQGILKDNGQPANGTYDIQFALFDALSGGSQVGSTVNRADDVIVDGRIITADNYGRVFTGQALWLQVSVRPGTSIGAYTVLTPRQPITAAPYALSLVPGALISGTGTLLSLNSAGTVGSVDTLRVEQSGGNAIHVISSGDDGLQVDAPGDDGLEVVNSNGSGVVIGNAGSNGIDISGGAADGIFVFGAGDDGLHVANSVDNGLEVFNSGSDGIVVSNSTDYGLRVSGPWGVGVLTSLVAGTFKSNGAIAIEAGSGGNSIADIELESNGSAATDDGVIASDGSYTGSDLFLRGYDAVVARLDFDADEAGQFEVRNDANVAVFTVDEAGNFSAPGMTIYGVNASDQPITAGQVVAVLSAGDSPYTTGQPLLQVTAAKAGQPLVGVVVGRAVEDTDDGPARLEAADGDAQPGEFVQIMIYGVVRMQAQSAVTTGQALTLAADGSLRPLQLVDISGVQVAESAPVLGIALGAAQADGTVWVLVNPR